MIPSQLGGSEVPQIFVVAQVGRRVAPLEALMVVQFEALMAAALEVALKVVQLEALKAAPLEVALKVVRLEALKVARLGVRKMHSQEGLQGVQMVRQQVRMAAVQSKADLQGPRASLAVIPTSHLQMRLHGVIEATSMVSAVSSTSSSPNPSIAAPKAAARISATCIRYNRC